ncbi:MAG: hypothetical protein AAF548_12930 [Actinomycetota bacterium]
MTDMANHEAAAFDLIRQREQRRHQPPGTDDEPFTLRLAGDEVVQLILHLSVIACNLANQLAQATGDSFDATLTELEIEMGVKRIIAEDEPPDPEDD